MKAAAPRQVRPRGSIFIPAGDLHPPIRTKPSMISECGKGEGWMSKLEEWMRRPQNVWLRKALFQVHLWTGIGVGLYVVAICLSGSALVFRAELSKHFTRGPRTVAITGTRMTNDQIGQAAQQDYPKYSVSHVWETK